MSKSIILGVHVSNRVKEIPNVQSILTEYGCYIRTRLGLHQVSEGLCSPNGLLILEMTGDEPHILEMETKLKGLEGVTVEKMVFQQ